MSHIHVNQYCINDTYEELSRPIFNGDMNFIIFHHDDNDGRLAAYTVAKWIYDSTSDGPFEWIHKEEENVLYNIIYVECNYTTDKKWNDLVKHLLIVDNISFIGVDLAMSVNDLSEDIITKLNKMCAVWIDHHLDTRKTLDQKNDLGLKFPLICSVSMCASGLSYILANTHSFKKMMAYKSLSIEDMDKKISSIIQKADPNNLHFMYRLVDIWDRYVSGNSNWDDATAFHISSLSYNTKPYLSNIYGHPYDEKMECLWYQILDDNFTNPVSMYIDEGLKLKNYRDSLYAIILKATAVKVTDLLSDGEIYTFIAINGVGGSELFCGEDLKEDYDFCMIYYYTGKEYKYSIFTNKDVSKRGKIINLQELAESYGGGGHAHAAGFTSPVNLITILDNVIKLY